MRITILILCIILLVIAGTMVFFHCGESKYYKNFNAEMLARAENTEENASICTEEEISSLPRCLRDFCEFVQLKGTKKHAITHCLFKHADFVFNEKKGTNIQMDYDLWIFADRPHREAFCKSAIMGIPFEGIDYFDETSRSGGMKGYLAKLFQLFDQTVPHMERTMYLTLLAENAMLNPSFLLSDHIIYEEIDETTCKATITYNGIAGEGTFLYDKANGTLQFESSQRQTEQLEDGTFRYIGWRCEGGDFHNGTEFKVPSYCKVTKLYPDREVVYFNANEYELVLEK